MCVRDQGGERERKRTPYDLVAETKQMDRLPMVQFATGGIMTPADTSLMIQLGYDGVFLESKIFNCLDPYKRVQGIIQALRHYNDPHVLVETSCGLEDSNANLNLFEDMIEQLAVKNHCNVSLLSVYELRMWLVFSFCRIKCCCAYESLWFWYFLTPSFSLCLSSIGGVGNICSSVVGN